MSFEHLSRLVRTTSFRLAVVYAAIFAASVVILGLVVFLSMRSQGKEAMRDRVSAEIAVLTDEYRAGGLPRLTDTTRRRALGGEALHYVIVAQGVSNVDGLAEAGEDSLGWFDTTVVSPGDDTDGEPALARTVTVGGDVRLTVGAGYEAVDELQEAVLAAFAAALGMVVALGALGGVLISRSFLSRIDAITRTAEAIISGDLTRRITLSGTGDDLDRLSGTLNLMLDRTQELMESLKQVSNDIAHDLRTPLARLRQKLEGARAHATSVEGYETAVAGAIEETDAILSTFASLLRIAQIEAGTRRSGFGLVDLAAVTASVAEAFQPSAEDLGKAIEIDAPGPAGILGDRNLLTQLVANLIENAVTHGGEGGRISVAVERSAAGFDLRVADDGPGVPDDERDHVFGRFYRLERSRTTPGNGLGLSLVAAVAELHGARVTLADAAPGLRVRVSFVASPK